MSFTGTLRVQNKHKILKISSGRFGRLAAADCLAVYSYDLLVSRDTDSDYIF